MDNTRCNLLPIGAFANAAQLSLKALRLYDHLGILRPAYIAPESGYRYYHTEQLLHARQIRLMRQMEMPLAMIRMALENDPQKLGVLVAQHLADMEARIVQARSTARSLLYYLHNKETEMTYEVTVKEEAPQQILSITKNVKIDGLEPHIKGSLSALRAFIGDQNGDMAGSPFGIFHGPVNQNDDGPMEVCWPVQGKFAPRGDIVVKELAGGKTVNVEVKGAQCDFPAILEAYDAGSSWVAQSGHDLAGPPREIWLDDKGQHMRIAWPFQNRA